MSEFGREQNTTRQQAIPVEPAPRPTLERPRDMAHPIDSGQFGGIKGALARVREGLRALGGVSHVPAEEINEKTVARAMELSRYDFERGTFTPRDVIKWLNYRNPDKDASPLVFQNAGKVIDSFVQQGAIEMVPAGPDGQDPQYRLINEEPIRRAAYPDTVQQAKPA